MTESLQSVFSLLHVLHVVSVVTHHRQELPRQKMLPDVPRTANIQRRGMLPKKPPRRAACWVMGITKLQKPALFEGQVCGTSDLFKIEWPFIQTAA